MNVNVLDRATLLDAMDHRSATAADDPGLRVRGQLCRLTREQQLDVVSRTFHGSS